MPLDPSIPLGAKVLQIDSPFVALTQIAQLQQHRAQAEAQQAQAQERALAAQERRQKADAEAAALRRAAEVEARVGAAIRPHPVTGQPTLDWSTLLAGGDVPPATLFELSKQTDETAQRLATLEMTNLNLDEKKTQGLALVARPVATAGYAKLAWDAAVLAAFNKKLITPAQRDEGYALTDPAEIQRRTDAAIAAAAEKPAMMNVPVGGVVFDPVTKQPIFTNERTAASVAASEPLVPVPGPSGTTIYARRSEAVGQPVPTTPRAPAADPLVQVVENGEVVWRPRSQAAGQRAPRGAAAPRPAPTARP